MSGQTDSANTAPATGTPRQSSATRVRLLAALMFAGIAGLLGLAAHLKPSDAGFGTHQQLGIQPCGMLVVTGYPCPSCGMTTALSHLVRGRLLRAFWVQPAGFGLGLASVMIGLGAGWAVVTGRWPRVRLAFLTPYRLFLGLLVLLLGGWGFKLLVGVLDGSLPVRSVPLGTGIP